MDARMFTTVNGDLARIMYTRLSKSRGTVRLRGQNAKLGESLGRCDRQRTVEAAMKLAVRQTPRGRCHKRYGRPAPHVLYLDSSTWRYHLLLFKCVAVKTIPQCTAPLAGRRLTVVQLRLGTEGCTWECATVISDKQESQRIRWKMKGTSSFPPSVSYRQ